MGIAAVIGGTRIPSGSSDRYMYFVAVDATDLKTREPGLSSFTVYRSRNGGVAAPYTSPTINETDASNMPGVYELLIDEDTTIATGNDTEEYVVHITQAEMAPVTQSIEIFRNVWDEVLTGATHNVASSAGRRLRQIEDVTLLVEGTATAGAAGTITLEVGSNANDEFYDHALIVLTGGAGVGQARLLDSYDGGTRVATILPAWVTNPSSGTTYSIYAAGEVHVREIHENAINAAAIAANAIGTSELDISGILASVVETEGSITIQQALQIMISVLAGVTTTTGTVFKTPNGNATRVTMSIDTTDNERDTVTLSFS